MWFNIYKIEKGRKIVDDKGNSFFLESSTDVIPLGRVNAKHHPDAMLKAFKKFSIVEQNEQMKIHAANYKLDHMCLGPQNRR